MLVRVVSCRGRSFVWSRSSVYAPLERVVVEDPRQFTPRARRVRERVAFSQLRQFAGRFLFNWRHRAHYWLFSREVRLGLLLEAKGQQRGDGFLIGMLGLGRDAVDPFRPRAVASGRLRPVLERG